MFKLCSAISYVKICLQTNHFLSNRSMFLNSKLAEIRINQLIHFFTRNKNILAYSYIFKGHNINKSLPLM